MTTVTGGPVRVVSKSTTPGRSHSGEIKIQAAREYTPFTLHVWACKRRAEESISEAVEFTWKELSDWSGIDYTTMKKIQSGALNERERPIPRIYCERLAVLFQTTIPQVARPFKVIQPPPNSTLDVWLKLGGYLYAETYKSLLRYIDAHPEDGMLSGLWDLMALTMTEPWQESTHPLKMRADHFLEDRRSIPSKILAIAALVRDWQETMPPSTPGRSPGAADRATPSTH